MSELERELFEKRLTMISMGLEYPRTPDIAGSVMARLRTSPSPIGRRARGEGRPRFISRKLAWSLTIVLILISSLVLIPPVRAAIIEFIQIGVVRIFPRSIEPTPEVIRTATPETISPLTATPGASIPPPSLIPLFENIVGETKLANAQQVANYPILLPTYPPELGQPNHVYIQDADGAMTILVWVDPSNPADAMLSLHFIPEGSWAINKVSPVVIQESEVNGQRAIWAVGPYPLKLRNGGLEFTRLIDGHVLVWADGNITYRIETGLPLEEAIKVAESLEPIP